MAETWGRWAADAWNENDDASKERRQREMSIARGRAAFERAAGGQVGPHAGMQGAAHMLGQGLANHSAAAGHINQAIGNEMQSRVAQMREQRRMEHEKELARMRLEAQRRDQEGAIIRSLLG